MANEKTHVDRRPIHIKTSGALWLNTLLIYTINFLSHNKQACVFERNFGKERENAFHLQPSDFDTHTIIFGSRWRSFVGILWTFLCLCNCIKKIIFHMPKILKCLLCQDERSHQSQPAQHSSPGISTWGLCCIWIFNRGCICPKGLLLGQESLYINANANANISS